MPRVKSDIDAHVSRKVAQARTMAGLSYGQLGAALEVTFQQVQKTCNGTNRISSGQLFKIAQATKKPVGWFFEGLEGGPMPDEADIVVQVSGTKDGISLIRAFANVTDKALRTAIVQLAVAAANGAERPQ